MRKIFFLFFLLISGGTSFAQSNTGSFLLIRSYGRNAVSLVLESRVYEKHRSQIKIDSAKIEEFGSYEVLFIDRQNTVIKELKFQDSTGLKLGKLRDSLKVVDPRYGMGADIHFARKMADSLVKSGVYFYTVPQLTVPETYELNFTAYFKSADPDNDPAYWEFRRAFTKEFEAKGKKNVHMYMSRDGELNVLLYLANKDFDLRKLDKYQLNFTKKPLVRPRLYELILLEK